MLIYILHKMAVTKLYTLSKNYNQQNWKAPYWIALVSLTPYRQLVGIIDYMDLKKKFWEVRLFIFRCFIILGDATRNLAYVI